MTEQPLYPECPLCTQGVVRRAWPSGDSVYRCDVCQLTLKEKALFGLLPQGRFTVTNFGQGNYKLAQQGLDAKRVALTPDPLKITLGNVYPDDQLAAIAKGNLDLLRPVRTILAKIILEQLNEACFIQVTELRRGHGPPLTDDVVSYQPTQPVARPGMVWQDEGNLFCTTHRLVFPSNRFTFIRLDRKLVAVQTFTDGVAVQRKGEDFATYFGGCYPHEAALVAAYVIAKVPKLQQTLQQSEIIS